jgi:nitrogen fixation regulatory protein
MSDSFFLPSFDDPVFRQVVEQSAIAISITDEKARILYANQAFLNITGYTHDEIIGGKQSLLSYQATPREVYIQMWEALSKGQSWTGRLLNRRKSGQPYVAELTVSPLTEVGPQGESMRFLGMHQDVTQAHRLERDLANQRQLLESVVTVAPVAVALLDEASCVVLANPAYEHLTHTLGNPDAAKSVVEALSDSLGERFAEARHLQRPLENHELRFERTGREPLWYACSLTWFEEDLGEPDAFYSHERRTYMVLVMTDVTGRKKQDETLRLTAMRAMLSEGELTQSLRETLSGAIYQLQRPVNLISAAAALQKRRGPEQVESPLGHALMEAQKAGEAAITTLQHALPPEPTLQTGPVNLNEVLRDVLMLSTERLLYAGITVDWRPAHVLPSIEGEAAGLRNLFRRLIDNAIEAMNVRGWTERTIVVQTQVKTGMVDVHISDTGPGIPEKLRLRVFEPFFSTREGARTGARGVGLSVAQDIVRRHHGVLAIDPEYTRGCRMVVSLPTLAPHLTPTGKGR